VINQSNREFLIAKYPFFRYLTDKNSSSRLLKQIKSLYIIHKVRDAVYKRVFPMEITWELCLPSLKCK